MRSTSSCAADVSWVSEHDINHIQHIYDMMRRFSLHCKLTRLSERVCDDVLKRSLSCVRFDVFTTRLIFESALCSLLTEVVEHLILSDSWSNKAKTKKVSMVQLFLHFFSEIKKSCKCMFGIIYSVQSGDAWRASHDSRIKSKICI